jgi:membrane AbrB-like protein
VPFLLGPLTATLLLSASGWRTHVPAGLLRLAQMLTGVVAGSAFTPAILARARDWPWSILAVAVLVAVTVGVVTLYYRQVARLDARTAVMAAVPGGLSAVLLLADRVGADMRDVSLVQIQRILAVVYLVPLVLPLWLSGGSDPSAASAAGPPARETLDAVDGLWLIVGAIGGLYLGRLLRLPSYEISGPLALTAAIHLTGLSVAPAPPLVIDSVQVILGAALGARFFGYAWGRAARLGGHGLVAALMTFAVAGAIAVLVSQVTEVPPAVLVLSYAPGGFAEMIVLALALDVDPAFVSFHHLIRLYILYATLPFLARWIARRGDGEFP